MGDTVDPNPKIELRENEHAVSLVIESLGYVITMRWPRFITGLQDGSWPVYATIEDFNEKEESDAE